MSDHQIEYFVTPCTCTEEDYMCDFGYERDFNTNQCIKINNFQYNISKEEQCKNNDT